MFRFSQFGIQSIPHYTPLHYLPFIARASALFSKPELKKQGFGDFHFRSMSYRHDVKRGFGEYVFLTLDQTPRILRAKLAAGFPHIAVEVPTSLIENQNFDLCRYNVAMTRQLRRGGKTGFPVGPTSGRYYGAKEIPIARSNVDKVSLLQHAIKHEHMVEVLIPNTVSLAAETNIRAFDPGDEKIVQEIIEKLGVNWTVVLEEQNLCYEPQPIYIKSVTEFVEKALKVPEWKGNGLEYDRF